MKPELTREQIRDEMTRLRSEYEQIRRRTKPLGHQTTRLYLKSEDLKPDARKITLNDGRKFLK